LAVLWRLERGEVGNLMVLTVIQTVSCGATVFASIFRVFWILLRASCSSYAVYVSFPRSKGPILDCGDVDRTVLFVRRRYLPCVLRRATSLVQRTQ
jgi:hypothetical protein